MHDSAYARFEVNKPPLLSQEYWESIESELLRLERSLSTGDGVQALGDAKCLVEATAKVAWDMNGTPADSKESFSKVVSRAHELLRNQPGSQLARQSAYGNLALQASKMAGNLAEIRNAIGGGHGRARKPEVRVEEVDLALDGALTWVRWALRRLDLFAAGRPDQLIRDLVGSDTESNQIFTRGLLARRLHSADLPNLDPKWQRAVGVAVGQRSAGGTFIVTEEGLDPAIDSVDLTAWPAQYRLGLAHGCLFDRDEQPTLRPEMIARAIKVLVPLTNNESAVTALISRIKLHFDPTDSDPERVLGAASEINQAASDMSPAMSATTRELSEHLRTEVSNPDIATTE